VCLSKNQKSKKCLVRDRVLARLLLDFNKSLNLLSIN
jgi:hypothetical protein